MFMKKMNLLDKGCLVKIKLARKSKFQNLGLTLVVH